MANMTIYLDADLHRAVKAARVPVSEVCQAALRRELSDRERRTPPEPIPGQMRIDSNRRQ
jgi:post-segregation antitoxin (ccd killing protein)